MMVSEWDGTAWAGSDAEKAATGIGVSMLTYGNPYRFDQERTPQAIMRQAQLAYAVNPWVFLAESTVTRRVVGLPWHLEDDQNEEVDDAAPTGVAAIVQKLLEKPQANLPKEMRQAPIQTWRGLEAVTSRHMGLCGLAHWYLDQREALTGIPLGILYINPVRMYAAESEAGNLLGWILDPDHIDHRGRPVGGVPLKLDEVLTFYLNPPDHGNYGSGIYQAARVKAMATNSLDQHGLYVMGTGGRIAGILSPKDGALDTKQFRELEREFSNVNESPDAAKRTTIVRGPIDWHPTAATPDQLNLTDLSRLNRDDILAVWGVPPATAGIPSPAGLNSGGTREYDEAVLMQGSVHDRVRAIKETIQYGLLDNITGTVVELEIEEPEFDDDAPKYEIAAKARELPLTNKERRDIIGLPPVGDPAIDDVVMLPVNLTVAFQAPGPDGKPVEQPDDTPPPAPNAPGGPPATLPPEMLQMQQAMSNAAGKASAEGTTAFGRQMHSSLSKLRANVERTSVPRIKSAVDDVLEEQKREIIARIRANAAHIVAHPNDDDVWWNQDKWDRRMKEAIRPEQVRVAESVATHIGDVLAP